MSGGISTDTLGRRYFWLREDAGMRLVPLDGVPVDAYVRHDGCLMSGRLSRWSPKGVQNIHFHGNTVREVIHRIEGMIPIRNVPQLAVRPKSSLDPFEILSHLRENVIRDSRLWRRAPKKIRELVKREVNTIAGEKFPTVQMGKPNNFLVVLIERAILMAAPGDYWETWNSYLEFTVKKNERRLWGKPKERFREH